MSEAGVDFDALVEEAKQTGTDEAMSRLWAATYALPQWNFIARGELPNVRPFIGVMEDRPFLMAFTDSAHARAFGERQGFLAPDGSLQLLAMPVAGFVETAASYAAGGVFGIMFNNGPHGYFAPLSNVRPMYDFHVLKK
ncbi:MAG: hypothetical protein M5U26_29925 [Planctomycetota bacterium]|nr:hypothetical protein [Planctomycetota bacterium]